MKPRIVHGATGVATITAADRGLNYGDGVFTTLRVHAGTLVWWDAHWARLARGAAALAIALPDEAKARAAAQAACAGVRRAVLKLVLTRGEGGRGYAPPADAAPTLIVSMHDAAARAPETVTVRWCDTRLAIQPRLAGHKHLNRLEQVLARAEWNDDTIFEGLLRDTEGRVVSATSANLFVRRGERWLTPPVHRCGVAGLMRAWCLQALGAAEADFEPADVEAADALFLCNAVRGILQVHRLGVLRWPADAAIADLRRRLSAAEPAFAME